MTRVLFIHGTMTRYGEDYVRTTGLIRERLRAWRDEVAFELFPWGEYWGAELNPRFVAVPGYDEGAGPGVLGGPRESPGDAADQAIALWALLYDDPTAELRLLAAGSQRTPGARQSDASAALAQAAFNLDDQGPQPPLAGLLADGGIEGSFGAGIQDAIALFASADPQLEAALRTIADAQLEAYRGAFARAIVAGAMVQALDSGGYPELFVDAVLRDRTVEAVEHALGAPQVLGGSPGWLALVGQGLFTELVLRPRRVQFTRWSLAFLGDIFTYQARRATIQGAIVERLGAKPTVLLAHSLGGVACADLLLTNEAVRSQVPLLITLGSQAGLLHEIGALGELGEAGPEPTRLPEGFPPWLNLYDRSDMLSFRAAPLFGGTVRDVELNGGQPFPHAHNAYWRNNTVWSHIVTAIGQPENIVYQLR